MDASGFEPWNVRLADECSTIVPRDLKFLGPKSMDVYNPLIDLFSKVHLPYPGGNKVNSSNGPNSTLRAKPQSSKYVLWKTQ